MATDKPQFDFATVEEAAEILQVHTNTIYRAIKAGKIPVVKVGAQLRIPHSFFQASTVDADDDMVDFDPAEAELFAESDDDYLKLAL